MPVTHILPYKKKGNVKDLVFTILTRESPLKIIHLKNMILKQYGVSVTFQGVRKALLELVDQHILIQDGKEFLINKKWIIENKKRADELYHLVHNKSNSFDATEDVTVLTFNSLNELMKFWQNFMDEWVTDFEKGDMKVNCYQGAHAWEGLLHLDTEKQLMSNLKKKGITSYTLSMGASKLDQQIWKFYSDIGVKTLFLPPQSSFDKSYYVGTYGEWILQTIYPDSLVRALDKFFVENFSLGKLDLHRLSDIVNKKTQMKLTIMRNLAMAKQINNSIISQMK